MGPTGLIALGRGARPEEGGEDATHPNGARLGRAAGRRPGGAQRFGAIRLRLSGVRLRLPWLRPRIRRLWLSWLRLPGLRLRRLRLWWLPRLRLWRLWLWW